MKVIIRDNAKQGSLWAAHYIAAKINEKAKVSDKPFVLGLCTGSTPIDTYAELIRMVKAGEVSFKNVISFNMDEYVGLPVDHPESYHSFMHRYLFDQIDEPAENIHILDGNAPDTEAECAAYEAAIVKAGGFDLFLGGRSSRPAASTCSSAAWAKTATSPSTSRSPRSAPAPAS